MDLLYIIIIINFTHFCNFGKFVNFFIGNRVNFLVFSVPKVGDQYALENEDELKDKMNYEANPSYRLETSMRLHM